MVAKKLKKMICAVMVSSILCAGVPVFAGTIDFNVTVGGSGTQDPMSKRELKSADGDNNAYFTATSFSASTSIRAKSIRLDQQSVQTSWAILNSNALNQRQVETYNTRAFGNVYYFMRAEALGTRVNVLGRYCP